MDELEKEWQTASDGFSAGIDFKAWLANQVMALRAAAQQGLHWTVAIESLEDSPWATGARNGEISLPTRNSQ